MTHEPTTAGAVLGAIVCVDKPVPDIVQVIDHKFDELKWKCPAGGIEFGETELEALACELREETGLELGLCYFYGVPLLLRKDIEVIKLGEAPVRADSKELLRRFLVKVPRPDIDAIQGRTIVNDEEHIYSRVVPLTKAMHMRGVLQPHQAIYREVWSYLQHSKAAA